MGGIDGEMDRWVREVRQNVEEEEERDKKNQELRES